MVNCKEGKTYRCGRACRAIGKPCKMNEPVQPRQPGDAPRCKTGKTRPCGRACRALTKPCKVDGTPGTGVTPGGRTALDPLPYDQDIMDRAVNLRVKANRLPVGNARRDRLERDAYEMYLKAFLPPARSDFVPDSAVSRGVI